MTVKDLIPIMVGWSYLGDVVARQAREVYERYDVAGINLNALNVADERVLEPMLKLAEKLDDDELREDVAYIRAILAGEDDGYTIHDRIADCSGHEDEEEDA